MTPPSPACSKGIRGNTLFTGDCLYVLNGMNSESVDLIYLDPPFNSKRLYAAPANTRAAGASFKDMWSWADVDEAYLERLVDDYPYLVQFIAAVEVIHSKPMMAYLTYMTQRILEMHRVLKPTGSLYLHCDPYASHYLKILLDRIFGRENFKNDVIWKYGESARGAKARAKHFARNNDNIFFYAKDRKKHSHSPVYVDKEYPLEDLPAHIRLGRDGRYFKTAPRGDYTDKSIAKLRKEGRIYKTRNGNIRIKYFLKAEHGKVFEPVIVGSIWDIPDMMHSPKEERTGYPTQKPLALLRRIIQASSGKGDVVLDPFCGCATTMVAAQQLGRRWIGVDLEAKSADLVIDRLSDDAGLFRDFTHRADLPARTDVRKESINSKSVKERLFKAQKGLCNGCRNKLDLRHLEVDHVVPKSKGGGDHYENYQLLCGHCNRTKGDRPMEYLRAKIAAREKLLKRRITFGSAAA